MSDNQAVKVLENATIGASQIGTPIDLGAFSTFHIQMHVAIVANSGQTLKFQHAAINENDYFEDIGSTMDLNAAGTANQEFGVFLRYVRWVASAGITTNPTLSLYIIAKE